MPGLHTGLVFHRHPFLSLVTFAYLGFVGWLTLTPQPIDARDQELIGRVLSALHRRGYVEWLDYDRLEFLANVGLFVPVGMFFLLLFGAGGWWMAVAGSVAITSFIETLQYQIPGRVPDDRDIVANTLGALIGVVLALLLTLPATLRRSRRRAAERPVEARSEAYASARR